jgi:hypothetical protein
MKYSEWYVIETITADGVSATSKPFDDVTDALRDYRLASVGCEPGETVKLHRTTSVVLASRVRA